MNFYAINSNNMKGFLFVQIVCFFAILQSITADTGNCNTPPLTEPLLLTIFDNQHKVNDEMWSTWCEAIEKFPKGTIKMNYRTGSLATGTETDIKCGSGDCKEDQFWGCKVLHSGNFNACRGPLEEHFAEAIRCYCTQAVNKWLLENAKMRADWKVPDTAIPSLVINKVYDPCIKFGTAADFQAYLCQVIGKKVGPCP